MRYTSEVSMLLVEDNDTDFLLFREIINQIEDFFIDLTRVTSLQEAIHALDKRDFDIIFLDLYLPDSAGAATFNGLQEYARNLPIVILSGLSDKQVTLDIVKSGAQDYIVKNEIAPLLLEKTIDYSIERKKYQDRIAQRERMYRTTFDWVGIAIGEYDYTELHAFVASKSESELQAILNRLDTDLEYAIEMRSCIKLNTANKEALDLFEKDSVEDLREGLEDIYTEHYTRHISKFIRSLAFGNSYYEQEMFYYTKGKGLICVLNRVRILGDASGYHRALISSVNITRLKEQEKQLNELNEDLENRVEERTAQLLEVNKELESFSYSVSHDLRAPLRAINGFTKMLRKSISDKVGEREAHFLNNIEKGATEMSSLIDDLLDFSRTGRKTLNKKHINMQEGCEKIAQDLLLQVPTRKVDIKVGKLHPCLGDPSMVRQVLINLIWNAIKYSVDKEQALIEISSELKDDKVEYTCKDNGMGFDMNYADKLFGVFQRLHQDTDIEGTGAGLAIVQRIIKRHGGTIVAFGEVGKGATFRFSLPLEENVLEETTNEADGEA